MSAPTASTFLLRWKGAESGPFSIEEIRELLDAGDISRLHQVQVNGRWKLLDDFAEINVAQPPSVETPNHRGEAERALVLRESRLSESNAPDEHSPIFDLSSITRTSGLAIAALILGVCGFIPYVNFVSWIFALIIGHLALVQLDRNASLTGRWMAVTGLAMTYFLVLVGVTYAALMIYHGRSFF